MKSSEEIRQFLENLVGWGLDRPWMYGGSPYATNQVFWQWRMLWAEVMERTGQFEQIVDGGEEVDLCKPQFSNTSHQPSTDQAAYKSVIDYWRAVDERLGIAHPQRGNQYPSS